MATVNLKLGGIWKGKEKEWTDISSEDWRAYEFGEELLPDERTRAGEIILIELPQWLNVSPSGGHRIVDSFDVSHYIPCGWKHLRWKARDYHFVK